MTLDQEFTNYILILHALILCCPAHTLTRSPQRHPSLSALWWAAHLLLSRSAMVSLEVLFWPRPCCVDTQTTYRRVHGELYRPRANLRVMRMGSDPRQYSAQRATSRRAHGCRGAGPGGAPTGLPRARSRNRTPPSPASTHRDQLRSLRTRRHAAAGDWGRGTGRRGGRCADPTEPPRQGGKCVAGNAAAEERLSRRGGAGQGWSWDIPGVAGRNG